MTQSVFEEIWKDDSEYVECHTSGSTGEPQNIKLQKDFMRKSACRSNAFFNISAESRLHTCLDFDYIASKMMTVRADVAGCRLTSETPSNRPLSDIGKQERVDLLSVVPSQMEWILASPTMWSGIRRILVGGAPIPPELRRRVTLSEYEVWESYGMTETASHIALRRVQEEDVPFVTLKGITVELENDGRLVVKMPGTEKLVTNDIAEVYSPEEFRILGRADNCVISGGIKIMPEELERRLGPFIAFDYCISSVPDSKWGERLVLAVEVRKSELGKEFLNKAVSVRLNQYRKSLELGVKAPKEVICVDELPRTRNGKIDRPTLKTLLLQNNCK